MSTQHSTIARRTNRGKTYTRHGPLTDAQSALVADWPAIPGRT